MLTPVGRRVLVVCLAFGLPSCAAKQSAPSLPEHRHWVATSVEGLPNPEVSVMNTGKGPVFISLANYDLNEKGCRLLDFESTTHKPHAKGCHRFYIAPGGTKSETIEPGAYRYYVRIPGQQPSGTGLEALLAAQPRDIAGAEGEYEFSPGFRYSRTLRWGELSDVFR